MGQVPSDCILKIATRKTAHLQPLNSYDINLMCG